MQFCIKPTCLNRSVYFPEPAHLIMTLNKLQPWKQYHKLSDQFCDKSQQTQAFFLCGVKNNHRYYIFDLFKTELVNNGFVVPLCQIQM